MSTANETTVTVTFDPTAINKQSDIIGPASTGKAGVMPASLFAGVQGLVAGNGVVAGDAIVYLSTAGDDATGAINDAAKPFATIGGALNALPAGWRGRAWVVIAPGTYSYTDADNPKGTAIQLGGSLGTNGVELFLVGGFTNEFGDRTCDVGSLGESITDSTIAGLVVDEFFGQSVTCVTGANAGQQRMIIANTVGGAFFVNTPFPNAVSLGDVFQIQKPSVTINKETILTFAGPNTLNMIGIKWNFVENGMAFIDHIKVRCSGCEFALNGFPLFIEVFSDFEPNAFGWPTGKNDPLNPFRPDFSNFPVGCYFHDGPVFTQWFALIGGYLCLQNVSLFAQYESNLSLATTFAKNSGFYLDACSTFEIFGEESNGLVSVRSKCDGSDGGSTFNFSNGACTTDFAGGLDVNNSPGDAFLVKKSASVGLQDVGGTGNAGFGINQQQQGKVFYNPAASGAPTTVTGTGGDVQVGANVLTYAAIDAGPGFTDATALMRIESN